MHPSLEHRGLFDFFLVGVAVPDVVGVEVPDADGFCVTISVVAGADCVGVVLREGEESWSVEDSSSLRSATVVDGSRGLPSSMSWLSVGKFVEAERNSRTLEMV